MMRYRVKGFIPLLFRSIEIDLGYYCHLDSLRCCWQEKRSLGNIILGIFVEDDTLLRFSIKEALYKVSYVCVCVILELSWNGLYMAPLINWLS